MQHHRFCERCVQWCAASRELYFAPSLVAGQFKTPLESQDIGGLGRLTAGDKKKAHFRLDLHSCGVCNSLNTLSLVQNFPRDRKTVVDKLLVTPEQAGTIRHLKMNQLASSGMNTVPATTK